MPVITSPAHYNLAEMEITIDGRRINTSTALLLAVLTVINITQSPTRFITHQVPCTPQQSGREWFGTLKRSIDGHHTVADPCVFQQTGILATGRRRQTDAHVKGVCEAAATEEQDMRQTNIKVTSLQRATSVT